MKLRIISEIQYKEPCTNMLRKNISTQYGATDLNDTLHGLTGDPRQKEKETQAALHAKYNKIKSRRRK